MANNIAFKGGAIIGAIGILALDTYTLAIGVLLMVIGLVIRYEDEIEEEKEREFNEGGFTKGGK